MKVEFELDFATLLATSLEWWWAWAPVAYVAMAAVTSRLVVLIDRRFSAGPTEPESGCCYFAGVMWPVALPALSVVLASYGLYKVGGGRIVKALFVPKRYR